jgi:hypothetical protein
MFKPVVSLILAPAAENNGPNIPLALWGRCGWVRSALSLEGKSFCLFLLLFFLEHVIEILGAINNPQLRTHFFLAEGHFSASRFRLQDFGFKTFPGRNEQ